MIPEVPFPDAPILLPIETPKCILWRGAAGAERHCLERAEYAEGPWTTISENIMEDTVPFVPFRDIPPSEGNYFYRMMACNQSGTSAPFNVVQVKYRTSANV